MSHKKTKYNTCSNLQRSAKGSVLMKDDGHSVTDLVEKDFITPAVAPDNTYLQLQQGDPFNPLCSKEID